MTHELGKWIVREATPEEQDRHRLIREHIQGELPELKQWARSVATSHADRIAIGTVLTGDETKIVEAIDQYAAAHSLTGRGAVVREALARLLDVEIHSAVTTELPPGPLSVQLVV